jgi:3D (Asp-Asp-Asp) domain-containing protein
LFTVLFGAMSLVGAVSYTGASEANQKYIEAENNKLRILEEQFNIAKNQEEIEKMEDLKAKEAAERAVEQARIAKEREAQRLAEEAAQLAITKAEKNILVSKTIKVPTKSPTSTPTKTTTTTTTNTTPVNPEPSMKYLGALSSTAYTHTGNNMANGEKPYEGAVACNLVPIGTKIYIEGYGYFVVKDRIGHGSQLDIFMDTYDECIQFGRRTLQVYVVN